MSAGRKKTIGVCGVKTPFMRGGAEILCEELVSRLKERGFAADLLEIPYSAWPSGAVISNAAAWRMIEPTDPGGRPIDLLITTKFPSYLIRHKNKIVWLFHQMRELFDPSVEHGYFDESLSDDLARRRLIGIDKAALEEHKAIFTISGNVSGRLKKYHGMDSEVLYPPPKLTGRYREGEFGDYILSIGRLDPWKRTGLLVRALARTKTDPKAVIVGMGPEEKRLKDLAKTIGISGRVKFLQSVSDDELIELYSSAAGVFFCPRDEDYGFITIEAFLSGKPVITALDSGGPTEFVVNGENGFVVEPFSEEVSAAIDKLFEDVSCARKLGTAALGSLPVFSWDNIIEKMILPFI
jgi:glycosyltransferase involved in cell wall biosynthesis